MQPLRPAVLMTLAASLLAPSGWGQDTAVVRPEAMMPESTLFYMGTDDMQALMASARESAMGRIMREDEVKEFLDLSLIHI